MYVCVLCYQSSFQTNYYFAEMRKNEINMYFRILPLLVVGADVAVTLQSVKKMSKKKSGQGFV